MEFCVAGVSWCPPGSFSLISLLMRKRQRHFSYSWKQVVVTDDPSGCCSLLRLWSKNANAGKRRSDCVCVCRLWMRPVCIIIPSNRVELCGGGLERLQSGAGRSIMVSLSPALIMTAVIIGVLIKRAERVTARLEDDSEFLKSQTS